ncbi:hypothetical protein L249_0254 [Ophiocordyceps polyrhachis-furcata BCC 54312]|uniref:Uncharacterized protein n=1 Tax=Ophiocordyceps polyrhachis-furcata BCC 54312 TaxID=1330021 RepID=A0A367LCU8_9HYPO|nr:hypothetical protein L249_0254 [Ophiocordyceps polyrhachis-furcata BCC 54312]
MYLLIIIIIAIIITITITITIPLHIILLPVPHPFHSFPFLLTNLQLKSSPSSVSFPPHFLIPSHRPCPPHEHLLPIVPLLPPLLVPMSFRRTDPPPSQTNVLSSPYDPSPSPVPFSSIVTSSFHHVQISPSQPNRLPPSSSSTMYKFPTIPPPPSSASPGSPWERALLMTRAQSKYEPATEFEQLYSKRKKGAQKRVRAGCHQTPHPPVYLGEAVVPVSRKRRQQFMLSLFSVVVAACPLCFAVDDSDDVAVFERTDLNRVQKCRPRWERAGLSCVDLLLPLVVGLGSERADSRSCVGYDLRECWPWSRRTGWKIAATGPPTRKCRKRAAFSRSNVSWNDPLMKSALVEENRLRLLVLPPEKSALSWSPKDVFEEDHMLFRMIP